ncbi:hypothetical protein GCM10020358_72330 [Amorphoplanes nipponensis]|uniref:DUF6603 domain-containing protein n=1 Tax=Actinoplanes nipponensis TaxID=135950 RepID=A0A919JA85_9ACTN|nr:DUF6603 domain-containing protein [Actinoplanes nipponensis]GIE46978.1 hypothetical protein Ani05nite_05120 [Actinoplanes nipponensis]
MLAPLGSASTPAGAAGLLAALGRTGTDPAVTTELRRLARLSADLAALDDATLASWSGLAQLLQASRGVMSALRGLERVVADPQAAARLRGLGRELTELLLGLYLRAEHPRLLRAGDLLTLVDPAERATAVPVVDAGTVRLPWRRDVLRTDRIAGFLDDPLGTLEAAYLPGGLARAADTHRAAAELFAVVHELARALGLASAIGLWDPTAPPVPPAPPSDEVDIGETFPESRPPEPGTGDPEPPPPPPPPDLSAFQRRYFPQLTLALPGPAAAGGPPAAPRLSVAVLASSAEHPGGVRGLIVTLNSATSWSERRGDWAVGLTADGVLPAFVITADGLGLAPATGPVHGARAQLTLQRIAVAGTPAFRLGSATGTRLELGALTVAAVADLQLTRQSIEISADAADGALVLAGGDADGFVSSLLPAQGFRAAFDLGLIWSSRTGFRLRGGAGPEAYLPLGLSLGGVTLTDVRTGLRSSDGRLSVEVSAGLSASIGPVRIAVEGVGLAGRLTFPDDGGNLGIAELAADFQPPAGLGLAVTAPAVTGGGSFTSEPALGRYTGALHIKIADTIDIAAFGLLQTGSAGRHWSLLVILAGHLSPIELGWGFRLTGLGGLLALHRGMDTDALRDAAYGVRGSLDDLLFPDDPATRLPQLLSSVERFFPPAVDSHVAGPMAELEWGPKAEVNARIRLALLLQLNAQKVALYGTVRIGFPTLTRDSTLRIRAAVEAVADLRNRTARFSITLIEAKLFGTIQVSGGAAFFLRWGPGRVFAFTIGGFHPAFRPYIPAGLIEPARVTVHWNPISAVQIDLTQYFAISSTSMQFGAAAHAVVGCSWGRVTGDLAFNVLVMTSPSLHLEADLHVRVTVSVFGADLLSAGLDGSLSGPGPWSFSGTVSWRVWIFGISKSFHFEWGERGSIGATPQSAGQILGAEMAEPANWTPLRLRALPVKLRTGASALAPRDEVEVRQSKLPFGTRIETMEGNPLTDAGIWTLTTTSTGSITRLNDLTDVFPEQRFLAVPSKERPFRNGLVCGARLGRADWEVPAAAVAIDSTATDDLVIDGDTTVSGPVTLPPLTAAQTVSVALPALAPARAFTAGWSIREVA